MLNKKFILSILIMALLMETDFLLAAENSNKVVANCQFPSGKSMQVLISKEESKTYIYHLKNEIGSHLLFGDTNEDESRGDGVKIDCAGKKEKVLVIAGSFTTNYQQAAIIRHNKKTGRWERINIAERSRPSKVYLSDQEMLVVVPNTGNETDAKYYITKHISKTGKEIRRMESNILPTTSRTQKIDIHVN